MVMLWQKSGPRSNNRASVEMWLALVLGREDVPLYSQRQPFPKKKNDRFCLPTEVHDFPFRTIRVLCSKGQLFDCSCNLQNISLRCGRKKFSSVH